MNLDQTNVDRFNDIAAEWDEEPGRVAMARSVAAAMVAALGPGTTESALEFGCGTGLVTLELVPHFAHLTAMDASSGMLGILRKKCERQGVTNITLIEGNVPDGIPHEPYDVIASSMTMHHVEDVAGLLRVLFAHLKPGGRVALADLDAEDGSFHGDAKGVAHHGFERAAFEQMLVAAGFESIRISTAHVVHKDRDDGGNDYPIFLAVASKAGG
ncbi:MAG: class I SAM-dependent DNA methyltransferase [Rhodanobacteraceae bacterium]